MEDHRRAVLLDCSHNGGGIAEIDGDHFDAFSRGYEVGIRARRALAFGSKHLNTTTNEILSEVRPVLAADACDESSLRHSPEDTGDGRRACIAATIDIVDNGIWMTAPQTEPTGAEPDVLRTGAAGGHAIRGGLVRTAGYGVGILLSVGTSAILLRHLGVEQFGQYGTIAAIAGIVLGLTDAGLTSIGARELSVLPAGRERERMASTLLAVRLFTTTIGVLIAIGFAALAYSSTMSIGMMLVGASVVLISLQSMATVPLFVSLRFVPLTAFEVARQILTLAAIGALALAGAGLVPFFAVQIPIATALLIATVIYVRRTFHLSIVIDFPLIRRVVVNTLPMSAAVAMNILYLGAMVVIVSLVTSDYETGIFVTSARIMEVLILLPGITMNLALPILSVAGAEDHPRLKAALQKMTEVGFFVSIIIVVTIVVMAPAIIDLLGGPEYAPSSQILRIQVFAVIGAFMTQTLQFALIALHRQRSLIVTNALALTFVLVVGWIATSNTGPRGAAATVAIAEALLAGAMWIALHRASNDVSPQFRFVWRLLLAAGAGSLVLLVPSLSGWIAGPIAASLVIVVALVLRAVPPELITHLVGPIIGPTRTASFMKRWYPA